MPLKVISDKSPNPENYKTETDAVCLLISQFVGGKELLEEALKDGDITIHSTKNMAQFGEQFINHSAFWDGVNRKIVVLFDPDQADQQKAAQQVYGFATSILFELCNATNKGLNEKNNPLMFPSREAYAKHMESLEFISFKKQTTILNATCKREQIPEAEYFKEYNDFEIYWSEKVNKPVEGQTYVHADYYRNIFVDAFNVIKKQILSLPQMRPMSLPKGISFANESLQLFLDTTVNLSIINSTVAQLLLIKAKTCPRIQQILGVNALLSQHVSESEQLAKNVIEMMKAFPHVIDNSGVYKQVFAVLTTQSFQLREAIPVLNYLPSILDNKQANNRYSTFNTVNQTSALTEQRNSGIRPDISPLSPQ